MKNKYKLLLPIAMTYGVILVLSTILASKIIMIFDMPIAAGIICFPLAYLINDIMTEVYGYKVAKKIIWLGFIMLFISVIIIELAILLPAAPFWVEKEIADSGKLFTMRMDLAFSELLGSTFRIACASLLAYLIGSFLNSIVLSYLKVKTKGRHLWFRTIGSTIIGESADSLIFAFVAFYGIFTLPNVFQLAFTGFLLKTLYEVFATPLTYYVANKVKKIEQLDIFDENISYSPLSK